LCATYAFSKSKNVSISGFNPPPADLTFTRLAHSKEFLDTLKRATDRGVLVVATTQCLSGSVVLGHYAVGHALEAAGVVGAADMTVEAACSKLAYLFGRRDLDNEEIARLMPVSLRGEVTPPEERSRSAVPFAERFGPYSFKTRGRFRGSSFHVPEYAP